MKWLLALMTVAFLFCRMPEAIAIRPFQIADDADAEEHGLWELEFGFVVERQKTDEPKKTVIDFPGEVDLDYGLPWNAEIGFDFRSQALKVDGDDTIVEPVSEFAVFYKQEFKTWHLENLDVQIGGEIGVDAPTTRERRKSGKINVPGFLALGLWDIYGNFDLHFLVEGEAEELGGKNDIKLSFGTFIDYPLPFYKDFRLVAEYGNEKVEQEHRRHILLGGFDWTNPFNIIKNMGGSEIEFDAAPFFWFTEGRSSIDWGITAGFEWVW
ncbi:MAG: hypothetical protein SCARUB_04696 [Candidatus Scalindua rubra]|uniref:Uncharacterized protein n=1 Tax=Candidatus Scalindua rubra TaxID=1872076 RepID=A0A1E3X3K7_9BACT|nr:MAG: hypothetical protein SCARUB_04696 [Candidatus Scalindua rubra]